MSETTKRIAPGEVVAEAYRKTGLGLTRCFYISYAGECKYGCGMGVYAVANLGVELSGNADADFIAVDRAIDEAGFSARYQNGFASGFDGCAVAGSDHPQFLAGSMRTARCWWCGS
jgi:hypothetical protein